MNQNSKTVAKILTYSGTLPLIICLLSTYLPMTGFDSALIAACYSAIIISFLCGIHWAAYLFFAEKCSHNLLISSNVVALVAWGSILMKSSPTAMLLQIVCFLYLLISDLKLRDLGVLPIWFYHLRRNATVIVVLCLVILSLKISGQILI
jgi:hypothetical protein